MWGVGRSVGRLGAGLRRSAAAGGSSSGRASQQPLLAGAVAAVALTAASEEEEGGVRVPLAARARCLFGGETEEEQKIRKRKAVIKKADELYDNYLTDNVYNGLLHYKDSMDAEILWRLCRVSVELSKQTKDAKQKSDLMSEAWDYILEAEKHEPKEGIAALHKWKAIMLNQKATAEGTKALIASAPNMRAELAKAEELDPKDPTTQHIIGQYYFAGADMAGWKRRLATAIWGHLPEGTYEQALERFQRAEDLQPGFYSHNTLYLGKCLVAMGRVEEGLRLLASLWDQVVVTPDDFQAKNQAGEILHAHGRMNRDGMLTK